MLHPLVQVFVFCQQIGEPGQLRAGRQRAINQQIGRLDKGGFDGQFLDGNATIAQDALLSVNKSDGAGAGPRIGVAIVQGDVSGLVPQVGDIHRKFPFATGDRGQFVDLAVDVQFRFLVHTVSANYTELLP